MDVRAVQDEWPLGKHGLLGLSPQNDFMKYMIPIVDSDLSVTFKYDVKENDK